MGLFSEQKKGQAEKPASNKKPDSIGAPWTRFRGGGKKPESTGSKPQTQHEPKSATSLRVDNIVRHMRRSLGPEYHDKAIKAFVINSVTRNPKITNADCLKRYAPDI